MHAAPSILWLGCGHTFSSLAMFFSSFNVWCPTWKNLVCRSRVNSSVGLGALGQPLPLLWLQAYLRKMACDIRWHDVTSCSSWKLPKLSACQHFVPMLSTYVADAPSSLISGPGSLQQRRNLQLLQLKYVMFRPMPNAILAFFQAFRQVYRVIYGNNIQQPFLQNAW